METAVINNQNNTAKTMSCSFETIEQANAWLAQQTNVIINSFVIDASTFFKIKIKRVFFEYTLCEQPTNKRYQIEEVKKLRFFFGSNFDKFCRKWQENNPERTFAHAVKKKWGFSLIGGSVGFFRIVREKYFILFSY